MQVEELKKAEEEELLKIKTRSQQEIKKFKKEYLDTVKEAE